MLTTAPGVAAAAHDVLFVSTGRAATATKVAVPGLRKTVLCVDGCLTVAECADLLTDAYQPCHGGFPRLAYAVNSGIEDIRDVCCAAGTRVASLAGDARIAPWLYSKVLHQIPSR